jgi:Holliday junction resolvasome RuvABC endonuclease subunit
MNMKILSFDQSTNLTGFSLLDNGEYVESGVIDKHSIKDTDKRIATMGLAMCKKIKEYKPDIVVIENIQKQSNTKTVIYLARLQGCIILYCASKDIDLKILHPTEWRSVLEYTQGSKVKREELKQQSRDYVKNTLGLSIESEDEVEAVCIGVAANKLYNTK